MLAYKMSRQFALVAATLVCAASALASPSGTQHQAHGPALPAAVGFARGAREWAAATGSACGDDVYSPFVPTAPAQVERILKLARVTASDCVCDLGFGQGAMLISAVQRTNCSGVGIEINGELVRVARAAGESAGLVEPQLTLTEGLIDAFMLSPQFANCSVVFAFLVPQHVAQILPSLQKFLRRPGARIVSERYKINGLHQTGRLEAEQQVCDGSGRVANFRADSHGSERNSGAGVEVEGAALKSNYFERSDGAYLYESLK